MKLRARVQSGAQTSEHEVELAAQETANGVRSFRVDGHSGEAHIEEITPGVFSLILDGKIIRGLCFKASG